MVLYCHINYYIWMFNWIIHFIKFNYKVFILIFIYFCSQFTKKLIHYEFPYIPTDETFITSSCLLIFTYIFQLTVFYIYPKIKENFIHNIIERGIYSFYALLLLLLIFGSVMFYGFTVSFMMNNYKQLLLIVTILMILYITIAVACIIYKLLILY